MANNYYRGFQLSLLNVAVSLGTFMQVLDSSIANVAIPYIAGNLSVSADEGTWVITSFAASNAIVLPLTGWLSNYFGSVRLFVWSVLLFSLTSFMCGFSSSLAMLVTFRVMQGAVAGSLIPLSQTLLIQNNPPEKRGGALGFWSMVVIVAPVLGPIVGGYLTDVYTWPWIFYINVPIGIVSAGMTWFFLRDRESQIKREPIDWVGLFLLTLCVGCLQVMLDKGKDLDWFNSNIIITLTLVSIVALIYFIVWTYYQKHPIVDFSFFRYRNFMIGTLAATIGYFIFFANTVTIPLWLQTEQNYTPFWAGIAVAPIGIAPVFLSTTIGRYLHRVDLRIFPVVSFLIFSYGLFYQANFTTDVSLEKIMMARFIQGFAVAVFFLPLVQISLGEIAHDQLASASGLFHFIRILVGSGFGTSLSIYIWWRREVVHHYRLSEYMNSFNSNVEQFYEQMRTMFSDGVITQILDRMVEQQAYMLSTNDFSWLGAWLFLALIPLILFCRPVHPTGDAGGGAH